MKVSIQENPEQRETEAIILCREADEPDVQRALSLLSQLDQRLIGKKEGATVIVNGEDVLYFDSVDKQTFMYTETDVLETPLRLYMLEERLSGDSFFRASKNAIINLNKITRISSSGIGALIYVCSTFKKLNCPCVIIASEGPVMQALEVTRLKSYFTIAPSLKEALSLAAAEH